MNNKYCKHSRLTERKFRQIVNSFAKDENAAKTAEKVGLTRKSVNDIFLKIRRRIYKHCQSAARLQLGSFKTPDCNFIVGSDLSLRSPRQKVDPVVFCAFFSSGSIQTDIIYASDPAFFRKLEIAIQSKMDRRILDFGFSDTRFKKITPLYYGFPSFYLHYGMSVKQFRDFALPILVKRRGISIDKLILHLKECEWRFNNRKAAFIFDNEIGPKSHLYLPLLEILRKKPDKNSALKYRKTKRQIKSQS